MTYRAKINIGHNAKFVCKYHLLMYICVVDKTTTKNKMKTATNNNTKNASAKTTANVVNINLSKFADKLKNISVKEKKTKDTIYIYPENFTAKMIGEKEGKQFRNKLRNKMRFFENNIFVAAKQKDNDKLIALVKEFNSFYKANYRVNDYSLSSVSQSQDETKTGDLSTMMQIITTVNAAIADEKTAKKGAKKEQTTTTKTTPKKGAKTAKNNNVDNTIVNAENNTINA